MSLTPRKRIEVLGSIKKRVIKHHVNVAGVDYTAWVKEVDGQTPALLSAGIEEFEGGVRQILSGLGSSHTVFYHERANQVLPQHSINATLRGIKQGDDERWMFLDVFEGGPAHAAGVTPGDVLLAVDGTSYVPPSMPPFRIGQAFRLSVSNIRGENLRDITIQVPYRKGTKERPPIVEPKSLMHAMIAPNIGLLKVAYFPGAIGMQFADALDKAITDVKKNGCDRLIIDLRGNIGGGLGFARLASYLCPGQIPIGHSLTPERLRTGYDKESLPRVPMPRTKAELLLTLGRFAFRDKSVALLTQGLGEQPYHGKIVLLVNEWTNSAAEMLAAFAADYRLATIVGDKTGGHVLGAVNFKVGGGYWLRLPVFGWYSWRSGSLENQGVSPDVAVEVDPLLLNAGVDQQMEQAIEIVNAMAERPVGVSRR